jgi:large subunit ribosomal protein L30e
MAKKEIETHMKELKLKIQEGKVVLGAEVVLKRLRTGSLSKIYLASNCPDKFKQEIVDYALLSKVPVVELKQDNEELGVFCKKNFFVSALGFLGD